MFPAFNNKAKSPAKMPERKEHPILRHLAMACETEDFQFAEAGSGKTTGTSVSARSRAGVPRRWLVLTPNTSRLE